MSLESEFLTKKKKKPTFFTKFTKFFSSSHIKQRGPTSFNLVLASFMLIIYSIITVISFLVPVLLLIFVPTVYLLIRNIQLERERKKNFELQIKEKKRNVE